MAWFGEHLNTITGKISDFTKEVILSDTSQNSDQENVTSENFAGLKRLCEEQDSKINELLKQREEMENSIVELDEEHQVIINELLSQKRKLAEKNKQLQQQVSEKEEETYIPKLSSDQHFSLLISKLACNEPLSDDEIKSIGKELNVFTLFEIIKNCSSNTEDASEKHLILKRLKDALKTKRDEKADSYINYLNLIVNNEQTLLPVMSEITSIMERRSSPKVNSCSDSNSNTLPAPEKIPAAIQTNLSSDTDTESKICVLSKYCQTESEVPCDKANVNRTFSDSFSQTSLDIETAERSPLISSVSLQTENLCSCEELKCQLAKTIAEMNAIKEELLRKEQSLQSQLNQQIELTSSLNKNFVKTQELVEEKDQIISKQNQDISLLKSKMEKLQEQLNNLNQQQTISISEADIANSCNNAMQNNFSENGQVLMSVSDSDKLLLQQKLKALDLEKSQLLYVLNEKSQECHNLKSEVHRLTNIVSGDKQEILKLQQENQDLKQVQLPNLDVDLTKEALQNLSRLVRDREVEIEALKQKNSSLTSVVQQSVTGAEQVQSLVEENEELLKNTAKLKAEQARLMASFNTKEEECHQQQAEIENLRTELLPLKENRDTLLQRHDNMLQQFEDKNKSLIHVQNEMLLLKQHVAELELSESAIKAKYAELNDKVHSDTVVMIAKEEFLSFTSEIVHLKGTLKEKDELIHEKDCMIHELSQLSKSLKSDIEGNNDKIAELEKKANQQLVKLGESDTAIKKVWDEKVSLDKQLKDKQQEISLLKEMNEHLSMNVKEKEFFVQSLEEKISSLSSVIRGSVDSPSSPADFDQILADSKEMHMKAQTFHRERDETLLALSQSHQEKEELKKEIQKSKSAEEHLKNELHRLRKHLLEIEEHYTSEALRAESREKELCNRLAEVEKTATLSSSAVLDASHQASIQVASLQEQIVRIAGQRDSGLAQISSLEDKVQQYAASLSNLQLVLEQMQRGHEQKMKDAEKKWKGDVSKEKQKYTKLEELINKKERELKESSQVLEAATRLSEKLDAKEELITHLKNELIKAGKRLQSAIDEIDSIKCHSEGKVDRVVMKSLVLGYFSTPPNQKSEVVRLLARVLDFNQQEMAKAGIIVGKANVTMEHRGLFSSIFNRLPSFGSSSPDSQNAVVEYDKDKNEQHPSFATLFVKFLETESQPIERLPLPAEEMAREFTMKSKANKYSAKNQLLAASPDRSPLLMNMDSVFPSFSPIPAGASSMPTILHDILQ